MLGPDEERVVMAGLYIFGADRVEDLGIAEDPGIGGAPVPDIGGPLDAAPGTGGGPTFILLATGCCVGYLYLLDEPGPRFEGGGGAASHETNVLSLRFFNV